jgi:hypothetical protein
MRIHIWNIKGYVYLKKNFLRYYERKVKKYEIGKLSKELKVSYDVIAFHRRKKLISVDFLKRVCEKLNIDKSKAEQAIEYFSEGLRNKYKINFPFELTPLRLRAMSLIIGDGMGSLNEVCRWSQNYPNINYGVRLLKKAVNFTPEVQRCSNSENCRVILIPRFLIKMAATTFKINSMKSYEFFKKISKLPREYRFQVFAQLVVDEGSPDRTFIISQSAKCVQRGIFLLAKSLSYRCVLYKPTSIYFHTENFPKIDNDYRKAKKKFGEYGGFWFKDKRFEDACSQINPESSRHKRLSDKEFVACLKILKKKEIFSYRDIRSITKMPESCLWTRIRRSIKYKYIIRINRNFYTFPEFLNRKDVKWLSLTKEEKAIFTFSKFNKPSFGDFMRISRLGTSQTARAVRNLVEDCKIEKHGRQYKLN